MEIEKNNIGENEYFMTSNNVKHSLATKIKKIIQRTFQFLDTHTFLPLYKTTVRSHLDYAVAVWYPYEMKH